MMKKMTMLAVLTVTFCIMASPVFAKGKTGQAGKSNTAHLYLVEKDADTWEIVEDGAWGKMRYRLASYMFDYVFNGHMLDVDTKEDEKLKKLKEILKVPSLLNQIFNYSGIVEKVIESPKGYHIITKPFDTREVCKLDYVTLL